MSIQISKEDRERLDACVADGLAATPEEALAMAMRLLDEQRAKLQNLRAEVQKGLDDIAEGRVVDGDAYFEGLARRIEARGRQSA